MRLERNDSARYGPERFDSRTNAHETLSAREPLPVNDAPGSATMAYGRRGRVSGTLATMRDNGA